MKELQLSEVPKLRRDTVSGYVYQTIRQQIMNLEFQPGQTLNEKELTVMLGVSRTPVREACIRLERQGLLQIFPQRGTYVSLISQSRIVEERFFRETLEVAIFRQYLQAPTEKSIAELKYHIDMQRHAYMAGDFYESLQQDDAFHNVFYQATNHMLCAYIQGSYSIDYQRVRLLSILGTSTINEINIHQHELILEAIIAGNQDLAVERYCDHVCKLNTEMERILKEYSSYFQD